MISMANSYTFVHICQPFDIYYVLIRKGHWFRFHVSCSSLIITFSSSSTRLLAILADFLSSFTNFTTFRRCSLILASLYSISFFFFWYKQVKDNWRWKLMWVGRNVVREDARTAWLQKCTYNGAAFLKMFKNPLAKS